MASQSANGKRNAKPVPYSTVGFERKVLACILKDTSRLADAARILPVRNFSQDRHQLIMRALLGIHERQEPLTIDSLEDELRTIGHLANVGGRDYLDDLLPEGGTGGEFDHWAAKVNQTALRRHVNGLLGELLDQSEEGIITLEDLKEQLGGQVAQVLNGASGNKDALAYRFDTIDINDLLADLKQPDWFIRDVLVKKQPLVIGGPLKCLKTSLSLDLAISLATATPFLGHFPVRERVRVAMLSCESGEYTIGCTAARILRARGDPAIERGYFRPGFRLPQFESVADLLELQRGLKEMNAEIAILEPIYLAIDGADVNNMYAMGAKLLLVARVCLDIGVTPVLGHHFRRSIPDPPAKPELVWLGHAGLAEFARQWLLVARIDPFDEERGFNRLWLKYGGSMGHSGLQVLEVDEGAPKQNPLDRSWDAKVIKAGDAEESRELEQAAARSARENQTVKTNANTILKTLDQMAAQREDQCVPRRKLQDKLGMNTETFRKAVNFLADDGMIEEIDIEVATGRNNKGTKSAAGLHRLRGGEV